jgi:hypothetical protein
MGEEGIIAGQVEREEGGRRGREDDAGFWRERKPFLLFFKFQEQKKLDDDSHLNRAIIRLHNTQYMRSMHGNVRSTIEKTCY